MNAKKYLLSWAAHYLGVVHISISILALSIAFIVPLCVSRIFSTNSFIDLSIFLGSKQLTFYLFAVSFICHNSQVLVYVNDKAPTLLTLSLLREVRIRARFDCLRGGTWSELKTTQGDSHLLSFSVLYALVPLTSLRIDFELSFLFGFTVVSGHVFGYSEPNQRRWARHHGHCAGKTQSPIAITSSHVSAEDSTLKFA